MDSCRSRLANYKEEVDEKAAEVDVEELLVLHTSIGEHPWAVTQVWVSEAEGR